MITGTPCQIASVRKFLRLRNREDDFLLVDLFCHGVPSQLLWQKYREMNAAVFENADRVIFRDKSFGWHGSLAVSAFKSRQKIYSSRFADGDLFYRFYLGNSVLSLPCYTCPFRLAHSAADIRLGDMWGKKYTADESGVSAILTFTERGKQAVESLKHIVLQPESICDATAVQMSRDLKVRPSPRNIINAPGRRMSLT